MKRNFELSLQGRDWWKPCLGFWVLFLVLYVPLLFLQKWFPPQDKPLPYFLLTLVLLLAVTVLTAIYTIVLLRILLPRLSIGGKAFAFRGSIARYVGITLGRMALSIVTLFVYIPWYVRRSAAYLVSETDFDGASPEFPRQGRIRLFVIMLLSLWLPVIVVSIVAGVAHGSLGRSRWRYRRRFWRLGAVSGDGRPHSLVHGSLQLPHVQVVREHGLEGCRGAMEDDFLALLLLHPRPAAPHAHHRGNLQPGYLLRLYRYFVGKTALEREGKEIGRLGFEGSIAKGFGLLWGQGLLTLITAGIYMPWAYARVGRWLLGATFHESREVAA